MRLAVISRVLAQGIVISITQVDVLVEEGHDDKDDGDNKDDTSKEEELYRLKYVGYQYIQNNMDQ